MCVNTAKLSGLQKTILRGIGFGHLNVEQRGSHVQPARDEIEWQTLRKIVSFGRPWTRTLSASFSRAVQRLAERGLIEVERRTLVRVERERAIVVLRSYATTWTKRRRPAVYREMTGKRASHVRLTDAGRRVAAALGRGR